MGLGSAQARFATLRTNFCRTNFRLRIGPVVNGMPDTAPLLWVRFEELFARRAIVRRVIVGDDVDLFALPRGWLITMSVRRATNFAEACRSWVLPNTSRVCVLKAAYRDKVPCQ